MQTERTEIIRAFLLEPKDEFFILSGGHARKHKALVINITPTEIVYTVWQESKHWKKVNGTIQKQVNSYGKLFTMGVRSREFIELICPPKLPAKFTFIYN